MSDMKRKAHKSVDIYPEMTCCSLWRLLWSCLLYTSTALFLGSSSMQSGEGMKRAISPIPADGSSVRSPSRMSAIFTISWARALGAVSYTHLLVRPRAGQFPAFRPDRSAALPYRRFLAEAVRRHYRASHCELIFESACLHSSSPSL